MTQYIILVSNSNRMVTALGTPTARTFKSGLAAERARKKIQERHPDLDFIVLPIEELEP